MEREFDVKGLELAKLNKHVKIFTYQKRISSLFYERTSWSISFMQNLAMKFCNEYEGTTEIGNAVCNIMLKM